MISIEGQLFEIPRNPLAKTLKISSLQTTLRVVLYFDNIIQISLKYAHEIINYKGTKRINLSLHYLENLIQELFPYLGEHSFRM